MDRTPAAIIIGMIIALIVSAAVQQVRAESAEYKVKRLTEALREERIANTLSYWIRCDLTPPAVLVAECYCPVSTCR